MENINEVRQAKEGRRRDAEEEIDGEDRQHKTMPKSDVTQPSKGDRSHDGAPSVSARPETAARRSCWVAVAGNSPVTRPRDKIRYLSQMRVSSSISDEMRMTAVSVAASSRMSFSISVLAPTSRPRVG